MSDFDGMDAVACYRMLSAAASDNAQVAVNTPCSCKGIEGLNVKTAALFLKIYDMNTVPTSANTPVKTLPLAASQPFTFYPEFTFQNGIAFRITAGVADADNTALVAGDVLALNIEYV